MVLFPRMGLMSRKCVVIVALALAFVGAPTVSFAGDTALPNAAGGGLPGRADVNSSSSPFKAILPGESAALPAADSTEPNAKRDLHAAVASLRQIPAPQPEMSVWPMLKGLGLCLATFCLVVFLLKKLNRGIQPSNGRRLRLIEKLPVSPKSALLLVEIDGMTRLVGVGAENITDLGPRGGMRPARIVTAQNAAHSEPEFEDILTQSTATGGAR